MSEKNGFILKEYRCSICNKIHDVKLNKSITKERSNYPFPYVFLHGELRNILTTLYIDKDYQIRGVDTQKLKSENHLFCKDHVLEITKELMKEIERLTEENLKLREEIKKN